MCGVVVVLEVLGLLWWWGLMLEEWGGVVVEFGWMVMMGERWG